MSKELSQGQKLAITIIVSAVLPMAPAMALAVAGHPEVVLPWSLAALGTMMVTTSVGLRLAFTLTGTLAVAGALGFIAGQQQMPLFAAVVMALFAFWYGHTARWGVSSHLIIAVIAVDMLTVTGTSLVKSADVLTNGIWIGAVLILAGLWGILVGILLAKFTPKAPRQSMSMKQVWWFAITMAVLLGAAMWLVIHEQWQHGGAWFILTLVIVIQPNYQASVKKMFHRAIGTVIGFLIALVVVLLVHQQAFLLLAGFVFLIVAMYFIINPTFPYWVFVMFMTPAIVLMESTVNDAVSLDVSRLGFTLLGVAVALMLALATYPLLRRETTDATTSDAAVT